MEEILHIKRTHQKCPERRASAWRSTVLAMLYRQAKSIIVIISTYLPF